MLVRVFFLLILISTNSIASEFYIGKEKKSLCNKNIVFNSKTDSIEVEVLNHRKWIESLLKLIVEFNQPTTKTSDEGVFNFYSADLNTSFNSDHIAFSIGNGTADNTTNRHNAFQVHFNGDTKVAGELFLVNESSSTNKISSTTSNYISLMTPDSGYSYTLKLPENAESADDGKFLSQKNSHF